MTVVLDRFYLRIAHLALAWLSAITVAAAEPVDYLIDIKPLLAEKCYSCHGALKQEAGLRLETRELMDDGGVIVAGDLDESELLIRISANDDRRMPPHGEGSALHVDEIALIRRWIAEGAGAPDEPTPQSPKEHWAFQPIQSPKSPVIASGNPIDALLEQTRREAGVTTVDEAARTIAIRRLYLDLIGLPPSQKQLDDDRPWNLIVDELLSSPAHAERWARHWMDVWRYSDWYGLGKQLRVSQKHLWHWRDWIIHSLMADKGYDRMVMEMIAGDELSPNDPDVVAATGFLARNYYLFNRTTWLDNTIEHTGKAFLGLTLNCAKCHDHKYDPVSQLDYYRFRAIFEPHQVRLDVVPGETDFEKDGLPRVFDDHIDEPTYLHVRGDAKNPDTSKKISPGVPAILDHFATSIEPIALPPQAYAPGSRDEVQRMRLSEAMEKLRVAEQELEAARQKLANKPKDTTAPKQTPFTLTDDFDSENPAVWDLIGEGWEYRDGNLRQTSATRERSMAKCLKRVPRDFEMTCRYTTTGGTTYKSVTFRFDQSEDGRYANFVYTSGHAPAPKVQAAFTREGKDHYPVEGRTPKAIEVGRPYELRVAVRGTLANVWLDGELVKAYRFPGPRREGFFSLSAFDATADFDSITIRSLPGDLKLTESDKGSPKNIEQNVEFAASKLLLAQARVASVKATIAADQAKYGDDSQDPEKLANRAVFAEAQLLKRSAEHARLVGDEKATEEAAKQLKKATNRLTEAKAGETDYLPLKGALKALETPAHNESQYPRVYSPISSGRRLALARWMASGENPLTARVAVNHVWMRHFGTPLVESVFDFGLRAKKPKHHRILDFLASELIENDWSLRHIHRLIVTSNTYRLSSSTLGAESNRQRDPENLCYWRANSRRMESQVVRDSLLSLAGQLDTRVGGPSIDPSQGSNRRSIYFLHSRDQRDRFLSMFDDADLMQCYRRSESIVPQQALALVNSQLAIKMASEIAKALPSDSNQAFVNAAFERLLCRSPDRDELTECLRHFEDPSDVQRTRMQFVLAILNHNDFVTIR